MIDEKNYYCVKCYRTIEKVLIQSYSGAKLNPIWICPKHGVVTVRATPIEIGEDDPLSRIESQSDFREGYRQALSDVISRTQTMERDLLNANFRGGASLIKVVELHARKLLVNSLEVNEKEGDHPDS